ncbi:MAG: CAP domain-containing protein [Candidatus Korobacteraceae bacterium]
MMQRAKSAGPRQRTASWLPLVFLLFVSHAHAALLALASPVYSQTDAASNGQPKSFDTAGEAQLVDLINQARSEHGLPPLTVDKRLTQAARKHTELMVQHSALSHQFEGEPPPEKRFANEGLPSDRESENVGLNNRSIASAHDGLMHSPPHRKSILDPDFNVVGVGVLRDGEEIYVTEDFARKLPEYSEPQAEASAQAAIERYAKPHGFRAPVRKPQLQLRHMACQMALYDALDSSDALRLPGVHGVLAWTADDPAQLPKGIAQVLSPQTTEYSLGACFASSVSHPGGVYWVVMVTY